MSAMTSVSVCWSCDGPREVAQEYNGAGWTRFLEDLFCLFPNPLQDRRYVDELGHRELNGELRSA